MSKHFVLVALFALSSACIIGGSGKEASEQRTVAAFRKISVRSNAKVTLAVGPQSLSVRGDSNLIKNTETVVEGDTLVVRNKAGVMIGAVTDNLQPTVSVTTEQLDQLLVNDTSEVSGTAPRATTLLLDVGGTSTVTLAGQVDKLTVKESGTSTISGFDLDAAELEVDLSGSSDASLRARTRATGPVSEASELRLKGPASDVMITLSVDSTLTRL
jgi:hypothetical protein